MHEGDREDTGEDGAAEAGPDAGAAGDAGARGTGPDGAASVDEGPDAVATADEGGDPDTDADAGEDEGTGPVATADEGGDADEDEEGEARDDAAPEEVDRDLFLVWRYPRVGLRNPQRMTNAVWTWLARRRELSAWSANAKFSGPSSLLVGPGWCASRFGRTDTPLPDGRSIAIGGEHEDYYDPDFFIYNDVIVTLPSGELEIYGYPHAVFPPTDFHSATLAGDRVIVIGCLGYAWQRTPGHTPVFALDTTGFAISPVAATGDAPGWISEHTAELAADGASITVRGGQRCVLVEGERELLDNIDEWSLDLGRGLWARLTDRRWPQFELARADGKSNELFWIENGTWHVGRETPWDRQQMAELIERLGRTPDFALFAERYAPPLAHTRLTTEDEEWNETKIVVEGVTIRFREESSCVRVMFEGILPETTVAEIVEDARRKLAEIERVPYVARRLASG